MNKKEREQQELIKKLDIERRAKFHNGHFEPNYDAMVEKLHWMREDISEAIEYIKAAQCVHESEYRADLLYDASAQLYEHWHMSDIQDVLWDCAEVIEGEQ